MDAVAQARLEKKLKDELRDEIRTELQQELVYLKEEGHLRAGKAGKKGSLVQQWKNKLAPTAASAMLTLVIGSLIFTVFSMEHVGAGAGHGDDDDHDDDDDKDRSKHDMQEKEHKDEDEEEVYRKNGQCGKECIMKVMPPYADDVYAGALASPPTYASLCSDKVVVTSQGQDGFGQEVMNRLLARAAALQRGYLYVHTPFTVLDHVQGNEAAMETFANLGADEVDIRTIQEDYVVHSEKKFDWSNPGKGKDPRGCSIIHACIHSRACCEGASSEALAGTLGEMRARYLRTPKPALLFQDNEFNVAVHMRRNDALTKDHRKVVDEDALLVAMRNVKVAVADVAGGKAVRFHVFTQGSPSDLQGLAEEEGVTVHIDATTEQHGASTPEMAQSLQVAFHSMVMADALVATSSSLGYAAGYLSEGRVFAFQHDRPPLKSWIMIDDHGNFTAADNQEDGEVAIEQGTERTSSEGSADKTVETLLEQDGTASDVSSPALSEDSVVQSPLGAATNAPGETVAVQSAASLATQYDEAQAATDAAAAVDTTAAASTEFDGGETAGAGVAQIETDVNSEAQQELGTVSKSASDLSTEASDVEKVHSHQRGSGGLHRKVAGVLGLGH